MIMEDIKEKSANLNSYLSMQVIDIRDVSFQSLSSHKVLCGRANPSPESVPGKLLQLVPKVIFEFLILLNCYGDHESNERDQLS